MPAAVLNCSGMTDQPTPPPPERKLFLASPETMPAILRASRGGLSKERWERVRKRCLANRPNLPDYQHRTAPRPLGDD